MSGKPSRIRGLLAPGLLPHVRPAGSGPWGRRAPSAAAPCAATAPGTARATVRVRPPSRQPTSPPSRPSSASLLTAGTLSGAEGGRVVLELGPHPEQVGEGLGYEV